MIGYLYTDGSAEGWLDLRLRSDFQVIASDFPTK